MESSCSSSTTPPALKEVAEKSAYIPVTIKVAKEVPGPDSGQVSSPRCQNRKVISIVPYYKEVVVSQKVHTPSKSFKNKQIVIVAGPKQAVVD